MGLMSPDDDELLSTTVGDHSPGAVVEEFGRLLNSKDSTTSRVVGDLLSAKENNILKDLAVCAAVQKVKKGACTKGRPVIRLHQNLNNEQRNFFEANYGSYDFVYTSSNLTSHPFSAASRIVETYKCLMALRVEPGVSYDKYLRERDLDAIVIDIGGNPSFYLTRDYHNVHIESPVLDNDDSMRFENRMLNIEGMIRNSMTGGPVSDNQKIMLEQISTVIRSHNRSVVTDRFCMQKSQNCHIRSEYGVMIHSNYNNTPKQVADAMISHGLKMIKGTFLYSPMMFHQLQGTIEHQDMDWEIDLRKDTISFFFKNESSRGYTHSFRKYIQWLVLSTFKHRGQSFNIELQETIGGVTYFTMTRSTIMETSSTPTKHRLYYPNLAEKYLVQMEMDDIDSRAELFGDLKNILLGESTCNTSLNGEWYAGTNASKLFARYGVVVTTNNKSRLILKFFVDKQLADYGLSYALSIKDKKFTPMEIVAMLRSRNFKSFVGKEAIRAEIENDPVRIFLLAYAIYMTAYDMKYKAGVSLQHNLKRTHRDRGIGGMGFVGRFLNSRPVVVPALKKITGISYVESVVSNVSDKLYLRGRSTVPASAMITLPNLYMEFSASIRCSGREQKVDVVLPQSLDDLLGVHLQESVRFVLEEHYDSPFRPNLEQVNTIILEEQDRVLEAQALSSKVPKLLTGKVYIDQPSESTLDVLGGDPQRHFARFRDMVTAVKTKGTVVYAVIPDTCFVDANSIFTTLARLVGVEIEFKPSDSCVYAIVRGRSRHSQKQYNYVDLVQMYGEACEQIRNHFAESMLYLKDSRSNVVVSQMLPLTPGRWTCFEDNDAELRDKLRRACEVFVDVPYEELVLIKDSVFPKSCWIPTPEVVNRSAAKLDQLVGMGFDSVLQADTVLDLGAYPGGMANYIKRRNPMVCLFTASWKGNTDALKPKFIPSTAVQIDQDVDQFDLRDVYSRAVLRRIVGSKLVDCIVADASVGTNSDFHRLEELNIGLYIAELLVVIDNLRDGGCLYMKIFTMFTGRMRALVAMICALFRDVNLVKPPASSPVNDEQYIVAHGFNKRRAKFLRRSVEQIASKRRPCTFDGTSVDLLGMQLQQLNRNNVAKTLQAIALTVPALLSRQGKEMLPETTTEIPVVEDSTHTIDETAMPERSTRPPEPETIEAVASESILLRLYQRNTCRRANIRFANIQSTALPRDLLYMIHDTPGAGECMLWSVARNLFNGAHVRKLLKQLPTENKVVTEELSGKYLTGTETLDHITRHTGRSIAVLNSTNEPFVLCSGDPNQPLCVVYYTPGHYSTVTLTCDRCMFAPHRRSLEHSLPEWSITEVLAGRSRELICAPYKLGCFRCGLIDEMRANTDPKVSFLRHEHLTLTGDLNLRYEHALYHGLDVYRLKGSYLPPQKPQRSLSVETPPDGSLSVPSTSDGWTVVQTNGTTIETESRIIDTETNPPLVEESAPISPGETTKLDSLVLSALVDDITKQAIPFPPAYSCEEEESIERLSTITEDSETTTETCQSTTGSSDSSRDMEGPTMDVTTEAREGNLEVGSTLGASKSVNTVETITKPSAAPPRGELKLLEVGMSKLLAAIDEKPTIFAHCISGDLGSKGHMTRGVALVFAEVVGRPTIKDKKHKFLTVQKIGKSEVVGIITKRKYNEKPTKISYNKAMVEFCEYVLNHTIEDLVLSPLGVTRDLVPLDSFAHYLSRLLRRKNVSVSFGEPNTQDQRNPRLRMGLTAREQQRKLLELIGHESTLPPVIEKQGSRVVKCHYYGSSGIEFSLETTTIEVLPVVYEVCQNQQTSLFECLTRLGLKLTEMTELHLSDDDMHLCTDLANNNLLVLPDWSKKFDVSVVCHDLVRGEIRIAGSGCAATIHILRVEHKGTIGFSYIRPVCDKHKSKPSISITTFLGPIQRELMTLRDVAAQAGNVISEHGRGVSCERCAVESVGNFDARTGTMVVKNLDDSIKHNVKTSVRVTLVPECYAIEYYGTNYNTSSARINRIVGLYKKHKLQCVDCSRGALDLYMLDHKQYGFRTTCKKFHDSFGSGEYKYTNITPLDVDLVLKCKENEVVNVSMTGDTEIVVSGSIDSHRRYCEAYMISIKLVSIFQRKHSGLKIAIEYNDHLDISTILTAIPSDATVYMVPYRTSEAFRFVALPANTKYNIYRNSIDEQRYVWDTTSRNAGEGMREKYKPIVDNIRLVGLAARSPTDAARDTSFGLIDLNACRWVVLPGTVFDDYGHAYFYDYAGEVDEFVEFSECIKARRLVPSGLKALADKYPRAHYVAVSKSTRYMNEAAMYRTTIAHQIRDCDLDFELIFVEGVPGGGKTTFIIKNLDIQPTLDHIVLTATRAAAENVQKRIPSEALKAMKGKLRRKKFRTLDAATVHLDDYADADIHTVFVDEASMRHIGQILLLAGVLKVQRVYICGDQAQIPYFNSDNIRTSHHRIDPKRISAKVDPHRVTHRLPIDATCLLSRMKKNDGTPVYDSILKTTNPTLRSLKVLFSPTVARTSVPTDAQILTFTQAEKQDVMKLFPKNAVNTIAEYQGNESEHVVLIRASTINKEIYDHIDQMLVAASRHKKTFMYITTVQDKFYEILTSVIATPDSDLARYFSGLRGSGFIFNTALIYDDPYFPRLAAFHQAPNPEVTLRPAYVVDHTPEQNILCDITNTYGEVGVVHIKPQFEQLPLVVPETPADPYVVTAEHPLQILQMFTDDIMPESSLDDHSHDEILFMQDALHLNCHDFSFGVPPPNEKRFDQLTPRLRTPCPPAFTESLKMLMKTFNERNGGVPELSGRVQEELLAREMVQHFKKTCIKDHALLQEYKTNPMVVNVDSLTEWLSMQAPEVLKVLKSSEVEHVKHTRLNHYFYMLKRLAKPSLDKNPHTKFASPQAIAYQDKIINAYISPLMRDMKQRLYSVLSLDKFIASDTSVDEFQQILNERFPPKRLNDYGYKIETDFSKFDKSQGLLALLIDIHMMEELGIPEELICLWVVMHVYTRLSNVPQQFTAWVHYQRKSGDPMTFLGNTLFLLLVLAYLLGDEFGDMFGMFAGDDSLVFSKVPVDVSDLVERAATTFNLEVKLLKFQHCYFCSKFLVPVTQEHWMVVPDLWKTVIKLGRSDLVNYKHAEEYRISLADNLRALDYGQFHYHYAVALAERYGLSYLPLSAFAATRSVVMSPKLFSQMYYVKDGDEIDYRDNQLPTLEI